jgi:hypothetical protein
MPWTASAVMFVMVLTTTPMVGSAAQPRAMSEDSASAGGADSAVRTGLPHRSMARAGIDLNSRSADDRQEKSDTGAAQRRHAVEHSEWYYKRLTIHKYASYATLPLFAAEYYLGDKLYRNEGTSSTKSAHGVVAGGIGVLFGVNTITGVWNLWEGRHESEGRARRITHSLLMLASDAGFVATAAMAPEGEDGFENNFENNSNDRSRHRTVAISSIGVATAGYVMMLFWK